jgi:hypothetical protein
LGFFAITLFCECLLKHILGPIVFHVHCVPSSFWLKFLHFDFVVGSFYYVMLLALMASSKVHSSSMSRDDSDGGKLSVCVMHPPTPKPLELGIN